MGMTCAGDLSTLGDQQPCDYGSGPVAIGDNSYALTVVNDPQYGITANAVIPQYILNGFTCGAATDTPTNTYTDTPTNGTNGRNMTGLLVPLEQAFHMSIDIE